MNYLCAGCKAFFTHIDKPMKTMAGRLIDTTRRVRTLRLLD